MKRKSIFVLELCVTSHDISYVTKFLSLLELCSCYQIHVFLNFNDGQQVIVLELCVTSHNINYVTKFLSLKIHFNEAHLREHDHYKNQRQNDQICKQTVHDIKFDSPNCWIMQVDNAWKNHKKTNIRVGIGWAACKSDNDKFEGNWLGQIYEYFLNLFIQKCFFLYLETIFISIIFSL